MSTDQSAQDDSYAFGPLLDILDPLKQIISSTSTPTITSYLSRLTSISLPSLANEQRTLESEKVSLSATLKSSGQRDHDAFVSAADHVDAYRTSYGTLSTGIGGLSEQCTKLGNAVGEFNAFASAQTTERTRASLLLSNHDRLLDILEMPSLVATCVQNGYYTEAMDLAAHVRRLSMRFSEHPLLEELVKEVDSRMEDMVSNLLTLLRQSIKLPTAIKVIGYLRRSTQLTDPELRYIFLLSRWKHLEDMIGTLKPLQNDSARYMKRYVELIREYGFAIFMQYRSIFPDDTAVDGLSSHGDGTGLVERTFAKNLLPSFAQNLVASIRKTLEEHVPQMTDTAARQSLLTQLLYCAQSLGRVGVDFTGACVDVFGDEWVEGVKNHAAVQARLSGGGGVAEKK